MNCMQKVMSQFETVMENKMLKMMESMQQNNSTVMVGQTPFKVVDPTQIIRDEFQKYMQKEMGSIKAVAIGSAKKKKQAEESPPATRNVACKLVGTSLRFWP